MAAMDDDRASIQPADGFRVERDTMGEVLVPADALYRAQTQRAVQNFPISGTRLERRHIEALARIKKAAARANAELGVLPDDIAQAIVAAADEVATGMHDAHFPVDVYQTGSGTSSNMNANEVIATLATRRLGRDVHPNDHVNTSLDDCDAFTWSLGCTSRPRRRVARVAITSFAFMFDDVPDPVWYTSTGKCASCIPVATSSAAATIACAMSSGSTPSSACCRTTSRGRLLDPGEGLDVPTLEAGAGDREVLHRPLGLGAVERVRRDEHLAHRVALDAEAVGWLDARAVVVHGGHPPIGSAGARPGRRDSAGRGARLSPQPPAVAPAPSNPDASRPVPLRVAAETVGRLDRPSHAGQAARLLTRWEDGRHGRRPREHPASRRLPRRARHDGRGARPGGRALPRPDPTGGAELPDLRHPPRASAHRGPRPDQEGGCARQRRARRAAGRHRAGDRRGR